MTSPGSTTSAASCQQVFEEGDTVCAGAVRSAPCVAVVAAWAPGSWTNVDGVLSLVDSVTGETAKYRGRPVDGDMHRGA